MISSPAAWSALSSFFCIDRRRIDVREAREVVERIDELLDEIGLRTLACLLALLHSALAEVVVFGGKAEILVALLCELQIAATIGLLRGHRLRHLEVGALRGIG